MKNQRVKKSINAVIFTVLTSITVLLSGNISAQNVGINTNTPNASAMLDVVSTNSGMLIPRMTMVQRDAIVSPATSLLIYQTDNTPGFYYNSGTPAAPVWIMIGSGGASGEWTDEGIYLRPNENTSARVYEDNDLYGFFYQGLAGVPGYFESTETGVDNAGVIGACDNTDYFGFGGLFSGGYMGVYGAVAPTGASDYYGVWGEVDGGTGDNYGVYGISRNGGVNYGVYGDVIDADGFGIYGINGDAAGTGVIGAGNAATANYLTTGSGGAFSGADGALGFSNDATGTGLIGIGNNLASISTLINGSGVAGNSNAVGVYGYGDATAASIGVYGTSAAADGWGTVGIVSSTNTNSAGVFGEAYHGVYGTTTDAINGWAVYGAEDVGAGGNIYGAAKFFIIDNPENPENEILTHTCIESPEAMVMYRGKATINANGEAIVEMPSYFVSLTKENEATVQITCMGRPFAIGYEWKQGFDSFVVYGEAGREISWLVMADRDDPYMQNNKVPVIIPKDGSFKGFGPGYYIHPEAYGQSKDKGYNFVRSTREKLLKQEIQSAELKESKPQQTKFETKKPTRK
jgi:hypothetical protein